MATAALSQPKITFCPPGPERAELYFDQHRFIQPNKPVTATFRAHDEIESPGIDWADYRSMHTVTHKLAHGDRLETPVWALDDRLLRKVLVAYIESRAGFYKRFKKPQPGTDGERLKRAQQVILKTQPGRIATLSNLCKEFVALKQTPEPDAARLQKLQIEIANLDTVLRFDSSIAATVIGVVHAFYRRGLDSVATAAEFSMRPPHVRQLLWRLRRIWNRLQSAQPKPVPRYVLKHLAILEKLAANHGGKIPTRTWLNDNGYWRSYEVMRLNPEPFKHLKRSFGPHWAQAR